MKDYKLINVADGVDIVYAEADRFKTNEMMVSFLQPLSADTASANAMLINMLAHTTKDYPSVRELNKKLAMLYGAELNAAVSKLGENQMLSLVLSSLADRFALDNESICLDSFKLLMKLIFEPNTDENGDFIAAQIKRESKLLIEKLNEEYNEKRIYALRQLEKMMFEGEPYAVNRYGTKEQLAAIDSAALKNAYDTVIKTAKIRITIVGKVDIDSVTSLAKQYFNSVKREYAAPKESVFIPFASEVKTKLERINVEQGKLVIGYRVNERGDFESKPAERLFADIFGGGPYSKLFMNVREKLSLCYYCSARYDRRKSNVIIHCGCEEENMDKAVSEIQNQLKEIENGNFKDELEAAKMAKSDMLLSLNDDSVVLCMWYANQITDDTVLSPSQSAEENSAVTYDEVIACAKKLSLDSIFKLVSSKEGE
ncbi:MAG: insulinase family protein [Eubacterium sp.]|nr:insulinase family protein [Eubacterium sp.]